MHGGRGASVDGGVTWAGVGGRVAEVVVPARKAFFHHAPESTFAKGGRRRDV